MACISGNAESLFGKGPSKPPFLGPAAPVLRDRSPSIGAGWGLAVLAVGTCAGPAGRLAGGEFRPQSSCLERVEVAEGGSVPHRHELARRAVSALEG